MRAFGMLRVSERRERGRGKHTTPRVNDTRLMPVRVDVIQSYSAIKKTETAPLASFLSVFLALGRVTPVFLFLGSVLYPPPSRFPAPSCSSRSWIQVVRLPEVRG